MVIKVFDLHIDLSSFYLTAGKFDPKKRNKLGKTFFPNQIDLPRLTEGGTAIFLANVCPVLATPEGFKIPKSSIDETLRQISFYKNLTKSASKFDLIKNLKESNSKKISALLSIEGAYFIGKKGDLKLIPKLKQLGVVSIAPTWNVNNKLGTGAGDENAKMGLTSLGIEFIKACEKENIIVDAVHASTKTFSDIVRISKKPFFVSHTACYTINKHKRNLTDEQIKLVVKSGGIVGLCFIKDFIGKNSIGAVINHLKHLIVIAGEDNAAIGSDFDGMTKEDLIQGLEDVSRMQIFFEECKKAGITKSQLEKVAFKNAERFFKNTLK